MNVDIIKGKWTEVKGKLRQQWGKLTDDEIQKMKGTNEELVGALQKAYGYEKDKAQEEINSFVSRDEDKDRNDR